MKNVDLTKGNIPKVILALSLPIMGSSLLQFTYNLVDMLWVGGLGSNGVASVGSSSFLIGLGYSINSLVVIGAGIKIAHSIGQKNNKKVKEYINCGILINLILGLFYAFILIILGKGFIEFLGLDNIDVERNSLKYLYFSAPMLIFSFFNNLYTRIFNSYGNNKEALIINATGLIINIILDPALIYILKLGVCGAAIATLISNIIIFVLFNVKSNGLFKYDFTLGVNLKKIKEIITLGFPMAFQRILFTLVNIVLAKIIARFGSDAIAAQKIGLQIESITFMVVGGLNGAISSFVGQNFGAKKYDRILEGYASALKIGIIYSMIMAVMFLLIPNTLVKIFIREENTILIASSYLKIVAFSQIFSTIEMVSNGLFTGIGMPKVPASISIIFTVFRIPMAVIFSNIISINGIWVSVALSSILKGLTAYIIYKRKVWREYKNVKCA